MMCPVMIVLVCRENHDGLSLVIRSGNMKYSGTDIHGMAALPHSESSYSGNSNRRVLDEARSHQLHGFAACVDGGCHWIHIKKHYPA